MSAKPVVRHASYLSPPDFHRLNWACVPVYEAFGNPPYLVGSALTRPDYRDVDLRLILDDDRCIELFRDSPRLQLFLGCAISDWLARMTGLPVDFQIQSMTEANVPEHGPRNPMGMPR